MQGQPHTSPNTSRPYMPGYGILNANLGKGLLPWSWATERLNEARTYWLATTRPDGRPHVMPVWGIWLDDRIYFSTGPQSRKARNLATQPDCVVSIQIEDAAVIVEGIAEHATDRVLVQQFCKVYAAKYDWNMEGFTDPVYAVRPTVAFGFMAGPGEFTGSATRWAFDQQNEGGGK